ncbi:MAG: hypothetical protein M3Y18_02390 [Candidatus Eremiobacteraeota bacterium]|nr:hypothetical protein [Candidatus Eremiobacteraeota bacterium]
MNVRSFLAAAIACAACLTGCGSPASGVDFKAPAGWKPGVSMFGVMQMWTRENRPGSVMMLMRVPGHGNSDQLDQTLKTQFQTKKPVENKAIKICGGQPAQFTLFMGHSKRHAGEDRVEMIRTSIGDATYMSIYARGAGESSDPAAESAIKSLCPKKA